LADDKRADFYHAIGHLIAEYVATETIICVFCRVKIAAELTGAGKKEAETPNHMKTRAIANGLRTSDHIGIARRLMELSNSPDQQEFATVIEQFNLVTEFRDRIVHRMIRFNEGEAISDNAHTYRRHADREIMRFKVSDVRNAARDLNAIATRLVKVINPKPWERAPADQIEELFEPWHCIPVPRDTPNRASQKTRQ